MEVNSPGFDRINNDIPVEFMNSLTPNGLPLHKLVLKVGSIVVLLRNLNVKEGLCNGTRLVIRNMKDYVLDAEIISGYRSGERVLLPRIELSPSKDEIPFEMVRRQFPIRLGFAMTINKSQGQTFIKVGVYLKSSVFVHGQLYVALSRASSRDNLKVLLTEISSISDGKINGSDNNTSNIFTPNIVFKEILN